MGLNFSRLCFLSNSRIPKRCHWCRTSWKKELLRLWRNASPPGWSLAQQASEQPWVLAYPAWMTSPSSRPHRLLSRSSVEHPVTCRVGLIDNPFLFSARWRSRLKSSCLCHCRISWPATLFRTSCVCCDMSCAASLFHQMCFSRQGFCRYLEESFGNLKERGVVIGYDARAHPASGGSSKRFASLAAAVFISRGVPVHLFSDITPTPFVVILQRP